MYETHFLLNTKSIWVSATDVHFLTHPLILLKLSIQKEGLPKKPSCFLTIAVSEKKSSCSKEEFVWRNTCQQVRSTTDWLLSDLNSNAFHSFSHTCSSFAHSGVNLCKNWLTCIFWKMRIIMKNKLFSFVLLNNLEAAENYSQGRSFDRKEGDFKLLKPVTSN